MDNNFENKVRDLMNDHPEIPFDENGWNQMEQRLKAPPSGSSKWMTWLPLLLVSLISFSVGGTYFIKYAIASERISLLEQQLNAKTLLIDTTIEKHVLVIYDTTYIFSNNNEQTFNTRYLSKKDQQRLFSRSDANTIPVFRYFNEFPFHPIWKNPQLTSSSFRSSSDRFFNNNSNYLFNQRPHWARANNQGQEQFIHTDKVEKEDAGISDGVTSPLLSFPSLSNPLFYSDGQNDLSDIPLWTVEKKKKRKGLGYYISYVEPSRFTLGVTAGTVRQLDLDVPDLKYLNNTNVGLRSEIEYGDHFSIMLGAEYFTSVYESEAGENGEGQEEITTGFPNIPPESPGDEFHEIIGDFRYIQIPIAFQYSFLPKKIIHPYLGLGIISRKSIKSRLEYEYIAANRLYNVYKTDLLPASFQVKSALGYIGFRYDITRNWRIQLEGRIEMDLGSSEVYKYENTRFLKFNTGLQYGF